MQATLRALLGRNPSLPALATQASELLFASTAPNRYVTAALLDLDVRTGAGRYLSAGHVDCLLARAAGAAVPLASTGAPLGLLPPGMPYEETPVSLEPGDSVLLYSDGVVDAQNADGEEFGEARLLDIVQQMHRLTGSELVDRVFDAIDQHAAGAPQFDDITLLVVRRLE
jgi:sigma-B regulation protein RsbU (phosphoserine phosphatase)